MPIRVMSEDFTLYRGETGTPHLIDFRCAHRQNQLSTGWVEDDDIRCFYHGWKYNGSGQCVQQPAEPQPFCERIKIRGFPVQEYLGFIWAYLGDSEAPPLPRYPDLEGEGKLRISAYDRESNYFQSLENTPDHAHVYFVHYRRTIAGPEAFHEWRKNGPTGLPRISATEVDWGIQIHLSLEYGDHVQGVVMPNIARRWSSMQHRQDGRGPEGEAETDSWVDSWAWRVPIDDESYRSFNLVQSHGRAERPARRPREEWTGPSGTANELAQAILRGEHHVDEFVRHPDAGSIQDNVSQTGQGRLTDRSKEHLGQSDAGIVVLRQVWMRELRNLANGETLKQWSIPPSLRQIPVSA